MKDLYLRMISINPKDRPEKIDNILKDKWFYSIKNISEEKKNDLIKAEFLKREKKVNEYTRKDLEKEALKSDLAHYKKSISDIETIIFPDDFEQKLIKSNIRFNDYITIKDYVNPTLLMSELYYSLKNILGEFISIEPSHSKLKLRIYFNKDIKEKDIKDDEKNNFKDLGINIRELFEGGDLTIDIKLYKTTNEHVLRFVKKIGDRENFLKKYEIISQIVKTII